MSGGFFLSSGTIAGGGQGGRGGNLNTIGFDATSGYFWGGTGGLGGQSSGGFNAGGSGKGPYYPWDKRVGNPFIDKFMPPYCIQGRNAGITVSGAPGTGGGPFGSLAQGGGGGGGGGASASGLGGGGGVGGGMALVAAQYITGSGYLTAVGGTGAPGSQFSGIAAAGGGGGGGGWGGIFTQGPTAPSINFIVSGGVGGAANGSFGSTNGNPGGNGSGAIILN